MTCPPTTDLARARELHGDCENARVARDLGMISPLEACEEIKRRWGMQDEPIRLAVADLEAPTGTSYPK